MPAKPMKDTDTMAAEIRVMGMPLKHSGHHDLCYLRLVTRGVDAHVEYLDGIDHILEHILHRVALRTTPS